MLEAEPPSLRGEWYGYQGLLVRLGGLGLLGIALATSEQSEGVSAAFSMTGAGVFVLGPLVVHIAHGRIDNMLYSLGTSLLLGAIGGGVGVVAVDGGGWAKVGGFVVGATVGSIAAIALDATVFGFEDAPARSDDVALAPVLMPSLDGSAAAGLGLVF